MATDFLSLTTTATTISSLSIVSDVYYYPRLSDVVARLVLYFSIGSAGCAYTHYLILYDAGRFWTLTTGTLE